LNGEAKELLDLLYEYYYDPWSLDVSDTVIPFSSEQIENFRKRLSLGGRREKTIRDGINYVLQVTRDLG